MVCSTCSKSPCGNKPGKWFCYFKYYFKYFVCVFPDYWTLVLVVLKRKTRTQQEVRGGVGILCSDHLPDTEKSSCWSLGGGANAFYWNWNLRHVHPKIVACISGKLALNYCLTYSAFQMYSLFLVILHPTF